MFRIAHVTDPHFRPAGLGMLTGWRLSDLLSKRVVGTANLMLVRRRKHRMALLEALGADLAARAPDHLVLTGDLGNVGLASEWKRALDWLQTHAPEPRNVTVIPGNHDIYTPDVQRSGAFEATLGTYQKADFRCGNDTYPFVRFRGDFLAFIAVNTAVPTGDLGAWGRIGHEQMRRLETLLTDPELESRTRVLLIHHPPVVHKRSEEHNLLDRAELCKLLARTGADLVLHGHDHRDELAYLDGPSGARIPSIGAGSASYVGKDTVSARYNVYELAEDRRLTWVTYAYDTGTQAFREVRRQPL